MAVPPRMLILVGGGSQALIALPATFDKALAAATNSFAIPPTHHTRLSCKAADVPSWVSMFGSADTLYITDNDSYNWVCAGKHIVTLEVTAYEKAAGEVPAAAPASAKAPSKAPPAGKWFRLTDLLRKSLPALAENPAGKEKEKEKEKEKPIGSAALTFTCEGKDGKRQEVKATVEADDLKKGPAVGSYLGTLAVSDKSHNMAFIGRILGPNDVISDFVIHNKITARLIFRPRSVRPQINVFYPEESSLEVSLSIADWNVTGVYPPTAMIPDGSRQKLRWFLRAKGGGVVEDLLSGVESFGLFWEGLRRTDHFYMTRKHLLYQLGPMSARLMPTVSRKASSCPNLTAFLTALGVPVPSRTSMIQAWLPSVTQHKQIAYRIVDHSSLPATMALTIIPAPQILTRIFVLFRGVADGDLKAWEKSSLLQAEMGLDWRNAVGWSAAAGDEKQFRVIELAFMEVFL